MSRSHTRCTHQTRFQWVLKFLSWGPEFLVWVELITYAYFTSCVHPTRHIPHHTKFHTDHCLLWYPVFLVLLLTVVIPQACLWLHRDGRPLTSAGWIPPSDGCISSKVFTRRTTASVTLAVTVALPGPDMWNRAEDDLLVQKIATTIRPNDYTLIISGIRLYQTCRNSVESAKCQMLFWKK